MSILTVPKALQYQFKEDIPFLISDKCCLRMKEQPLDNYSKASNRPIAITGIRKDEGGRRSIHKGCFAFGDKPTFSPLKVVSDEWEDEFIKRKNIELCELYYPPYNFKRTGCIGCPFNKNLQKDLNTMYKLLPNEYKQALHLWKPVYDEYIRIGYRLEYYPHEKGVQMTMQDFMEVENNAKG